jgi:hypothetical protein
LDWEGAIWLARPWRDISEIIESGRRRRKRKKNRRRFEPPVFVSSRARETQPPSTLGAKGGCFDRT